MPTILCVDDSPKTLRLLSSVLRLCGYQVLTACDPDAAMGVAEHSHFDLAILDYQLPIMSGTDLARAFKRIKPSVPIMLFSGSIPLPADDLEAVDACVPKGENVDDLLHTIRELAQPASSGAANATRHAQSAKPQRLRRQEPPDETSNRDWRSEVVEDGSHATLS